MISIGATPNRPVNRQHPGCIVLLLDQSDSMRDPIRIDAAVAEASGYPTGEGTRPKADAVADAVNNLIYTIILRCTKDEHGPRDHFDIGVLGYGGDHVVESLLPGRLAGRELASVSELARAVARSAVRDGVKYPVWFDPVARGGTPMCGALNVAGQITSAWVKNHRESFPPIVINITDGMPTDGNPEVWATRLRSVTTAYGNLLLMTIHLSESDQKPVRYPASEDEVADDYARQMFRICSELPEFMRERAANLGVPTRPGARGLVCNADLRAVIQALEVGTRLDGLR
jgi:hypothetical protein